MKYERMNERSGVNVCVLCERTYLQFSKYRVSHLRRSLFCPVITHVGRFELGELGVPGKEGSHIKVCCNWVGVSSVRQDDGADEPLHKITTKVFGK